MARASESHENEEREDLAVDMSDETTRRDVMRAAATAGATGAISSVAGCTGGNDNNNNGDDGSNGGDNDDDDDMDATDTEGQSNDRKIVRVIMAPAGFMGIIFDELVNKTDVFSQHFDENNLDVRLDTSWEEAAIFTSGGADFSSMGSLEAAMLAGERDIPLQVNANVAPNYLGSYVQRGGDLSPDNTGSAEATFDKLIEEDIPYAIHGWGGGLAASLQVAFPVSYGYSISQNSAESEVRIITADIRTAPQLIADGELQISALSPVLNAVPQMVGENPPIEQVNQWGEDIKSELGAWPQFNSWTSSQKFGDNWPGAVEAMVQAYYEGTEWFYNDPVNIVTGSDEHMEQVGLDSQEQAEFLVKWGITLEDPGAFENDMPIIYKDVGLTDQFIEGDKKFIGSASDTGIVNENWSDNLRYAKIDQQGDQDYTL